MRKKHKVSVHIFRRDLRLEDNTALSHALQESELVIPCFILNPEQISKNQYLSNNALQFMFSCLRSLDERLQRYTSQLYLFHGNNEEIIQKLQEEIGIDAIYFNKGQWNALLRLKTLI